MKSTFYTRRQAILRSDDTVTNKLEKYSALKMPPLVNFVVLSSNIFLHSFHSFHLSFFLSIFVSSFTPVSVRLLSSFLFLSFPFFLPFSYFFLTFIPLQRIFLFIYTYLFICLFIYLFIYLLIHTYLFIYLFILLIFSSSFLSLETDVIYFVPLS